MVATSVVARWADLGFFATWLLVCSIATFIAHQHHDDSHHGSPTQQLVSQPARGQVEGFDHLTEVSTPAQSLARTHSDFLSHANSNRKAKARAPATFTSSVQNLVQVRTRDVKAAEAAALKAEAEKRTRQTAAAEAAVAALKRRAAKQASNAVFAQSSTEKRVEKIVVEAALEDGKSAERLADAAVRKAAGAHRAAGAARADRQAAKEAEKVAAKAAAEQRAAEREEKKAAEVAAGVPTTQAIQLHLERLTKLAEVAATNTAEEDPMCGEFMACPRVFRPSNSDPGDWACVNGTRCPDISNYIQVSVKTRKDTNRGEWAGRPPRSSPTIIEIRARLERIKMMLASGYSEQFSAASNKASTVTSTGTSTDTICDSDLTACPRVFNPSANRPEDWVCIQEKMCPEHISGGPRV